MPLTYADWTQDQKFAAECQMLHYAYRSPLYNDCAKYGYQKNPLVDPFNTPANMATSTTPAPPKTLPELAQLYIDTGNEFRTQIAGLTQGIQTLETKQALSEAKPAAPAGMSTNTMLLIFGALVVFLFLRKKL